MITIIQLGNVFRDNLRRLMALRGWSQKDFAAAMQISQPYASQLLSGIREPGLATLEKVAQIFDVQPDELLRERISKN